MALFGFEYPPSHTGGLGVHVAGLAAYLRSRGDVVDVFRVGPDAGTPAPHGVIALPALDPALLHTGSIDIEALPGVSLIRSRHQRAPYDAAHCHDWHGAPWAAWLWQHGVPLVTTCHLPARTRFQYGGAEVPIVAPLLESLALRLSTHVVAVSHFVAMEIERQYRSFADKVCVVNNGTDTTLFDLPQSYVDSPRVLAVGRLTAQKGSLELVEIFAAVHRKVSGATLRIVGAGPDEEAVRSSVRSNGLTEVIALLGFLGQSELAQQYRQARVLAVPSVYEPFGLVAIEAMASGVPVVAYATGGLTEIVTDGVDGVLVPPHDQASFATALVRLLNDPRLARELGHRARQTVLARFRNEQCFARVRVLYED